MHKVVVNSTPLIILASIDKLEILKKLYGRVFIPNGVLNEISVKGDLKLGKEQIRKYDFIKVKEIRNQQTKKFFRTSLHIGEVEVMILYDEIQANLCVIDDLLARKYAEHLGLIVTGTLGILLKAKQKGIISPLKPLLDKLIKNGFYIDDKLYDQILQIAGET